MVNHQENRQRGNRRGESPPIVNSIQDHEDENKNLHKGCKNPPVYKLPASFSTFTLFFFRGACRVCFFTHGTMIRDRACKNPLRIFHRRNTRRYLIGAHTYVVSCATRLHPRCVIVANTSTGVPPPSANPKLTYRRR